jgi:hypothetical protein
MLADLNGIIGTPDVLSPAESSLLESTGGLGVLWCGRGSTALYWALRALAFSKGSTGGEVIIPASNCESVGRAALLAGFSPRFADVDEETGLVTLEGIRARSSPSTSGVMATHLYGATHDLSEIAQWCRDHGVVLIEDAAQALGARFVNGKPVGSYGDMTIFSFNRTKIIVCGGGALVIRLPDLWNGLREALQREYRPCATDERRLRLLEMSARDIEHGLISAFRAERGRDWCQCVRRMTPDYRALYLRPLVDPHALARGWSQIPAVLSRRLEKAHCYAVHLSDGPWDLIDGWRISGTCWRFSLLVDFPNDQLAFTDEIRQHGALVSNLYWPLNEFFAPTDACPHAHRVARRVLNLCVDDTVEIGWVQRQAIMIRKCGERYARRPQQPAGTLQ